MKRSAVLKKKLQKLEKEIAELILPAVVPPAQMTLQVCFTVSKGKDLDGNDVDDSFFAKKQSYSCKFLVQWMQAMCRELSKLNELNEKLKEMGGEVVGINTDTLDDNQDGIKEAKRNPESSGCFLQEPDFRFQFNRRKLCWKHHGIP